MQGVRTRWYPHRGTTALDGGLRRRPSLPFVNHYEPWQFQDEGADQDVRGRPRGAATRHTAAKITTIIVAPERSTKSSRKLWTSSLLSSVGGLQVLGQFGPVHVAFAPTSPTAPTVMGAKRRKGMGRKPQPHRQHTGPSLLSPWSRRLLLQPRKPRSRKLRQRRGSRLQGRSFWTG